MTVGENEEEGCGVTKLGNEMVRYGLRDVKPAVQRLPPTDGCSSPGDTFLALRTDNFLFSCSRLPSCLSFPGNGGAIVQRAQKERPGR